MVQPSYPLHLAIPEATHRLGYALGCLLPAGTVLLLEGPLGSGKTTLVQGLGDALGISESLVSPTFALISEYDDGRIPLYHFDLYRLEPAEVNTLYPEMYWQGCDYPAGIVAIEWGDRLVHRPESYLHIQIFYSHLDSASSQFLQTGRTAILTPVGAITFPWDDLKQAIALPYV